MYHKCNVCITNETNESYDMHNFNEIYCMNENTRMKMNFMNDTHNIHEIDKMNNKNITWMKFAK